MCRLHLKLSPAIMLIALQTLNLFGYYAATLWPYSNDPGDMRIESGDKPANLLRCPGIWMNLL